MNPLWASSLLCAERCWCGWPNLCVHLVTYCTILLSVNCEKNLKCAEDTFARLVLFMNALKHET